MTADAFVAASELHTPAQVENVRRSVIRWERGDVRNPNRATQEAIARMFDLPVNDFWPTRPLADSGIPDRLAPDAFAELIEALRMPKVGSPHIDQAVVEVDRLCSEYASREPVALLTDAGEWTEELAGLIMHGKVNLAGHTRVLRLTGWLALLRSCLMWDLGRAAESRQARTLADGIASDLGDPVLGAWAAEIASWTALTLGDMPQAIASADVGLARTATAPVAAQLWSQKAKAYSRLADEHKTEVALEHVREILDRNDPPTNVRNHFAVDPTKASFYAMDAHRVLGNDSLADALAETVIRSSMAPDGRVISPMRLSEAQLTRAVVLARAGDVDQALAQADAAMRHDRRCAPNLQLVASEVAAAVRRYRPGAAAPFTRHVEELARLTR